MASIAISSLFYPYAHCVELKIFYLSVKLRLWELWNGGLPLLQTLIESIYIITFLSIFVNSCTPVISHRYF